MHSLARQRIQKIITDAVDEALAAVKHDSRKDEWVSTKDACAMLGTGFSPDILRSKIELGLFEYNTHYRDTSDGDRPNYVFKVRAIEEYFATPPEQRKPARKNAA